MACLPPKQLYDCERRDSTNTEVFSVTPGTVSEVTSQGLADGQTIPILVKDETGEFVPYLVDGEQLVLSEDNPSVVIEEEGMYKLDTSAIECPEGGITVTAQPTASDVSTSVTGCYIDAEGNSVPVEIIRYSDGTTPVVYNLGTGERIANPVGDFNQNCCDCEEPLPVQVISDTEQLGCVTDVDGNVTGKVYFIPQFDEDGNVTSSRMIMVAVDGTVTDPYTGTWGVCDTEDCPTAFTTECFVLREAQAQYDNAGGSNPELCGAPSSGPTNNFGEVGFTCQPQYQITSWIVDGVEVVVDPVIFGPSDKCGPDVDDQIGMHSEWARALNLLDGASGWEVANTPECAWYVRILDQQKSYGTMVIQEVADPSREWVINQAVENISEDMFTRVWQQECDGSVSSFWTDADGVEVDRPEGNLQPCGEVPEADCVTCETLVLCDTINNPDPTEGIPWNVVEIEEDADDPEHILHFHMSPADDPTKVGIVTFQSSTPFNANGCEFPGVDYAISNPSRRTITLDEVAQEMHAFQFNMIDFDTFEPTYIPTGFPIPTRLGGTAYWTGEPGNNVNILPTESNGTGLLIWDNPPETLAIQVGNTGGGNSCSNVDFEALTLSTMNRPFLRTICRGCDGQVVSVTDTDMDGVTPYTPVGDVTSCTSEETYSPPEPEPVSVQYTAEMATSTGGILTLGTANQDLVSVSIRHRSGTVLVNGTELDPGEIVEWDAGDDPNGHLFPDIEVDTTDGSARIIYQRGGYPQ